MGIPACLGGDKCPWLTLPQGNTWIIILSS